jgi:DNA/RNA endonuclease YhcR with UshA esterase domain
MIIRYMLIIALGFLVQAGYAQTTDAQLTAPEDVPKKIGEQVRVRCTIVNVAHIEKGKTNVTFLDLGQNWKKNPFRIVLFEQDKVNGFPEDLTVAYQGKLVEITGTVGQHNSTPQIILNNASQIKVINP